MKIAFFTDTFYPDINGVARTLKRFTDYLENRNLDVKVFAPGGDSNEYVSNHIHYFKSLPFFLYPECRMAFPSPASIREELLSFAPDLIHVATPFNLGLYGVYYANKFNIPLVGSYHTNFDHYLQFYDLQVLTKYLWKYMNWFHRPFKKLFVPSLDTLDKLKRHGFTNLEIWPRGVDADLFHPHYDKSAVRKKYQITKKYVLLYVGRLAPEKDIKTLLGIAESMPPYLADNIQWIIAGDGPLRQQLQNEAPENMTFTGYLKGEQLAELYSAADLFIFPSPTETFGNVVLESLASGTPVICANAGGVKHIVQDNRTGYLCEAGNGQDFTSSIVNLIRNKNLRRQMGTEGRNYALSQKWDAIFESLLWHYSLAIQEAREKRYQVP
ncbi:glycosyltransferase family 1 protein [Mesobacillus foraminis]|uniref:glycosyltransferase family 4 protein n=1 Tax=Mesobacillus foraminis TaxID=279826 RepID=UPI001BEBA794|nr:glycosyltransferase family 1 protein [Mesobacillus foraminis]MBT2759116.1 glycosyltransferase family 1 protein [Mesobacillus foraminis]